MHPTGFDVFELYNRGMPNYRRWYVPGGTVFFTLVTHHRQPLFADPLASKLLGTSFRDICSIHPFKTVAVVLLPDHLHSIWNLPEGDHDFSTRWQLIKQDFTSKWLHADGVEGALTPSQVHRGNRGIWQRRFWEHQVDNPEELEALCDYIHFNPVKHGYVACPADWPHSSFHRYVKMSHYPPNWGTSEPTNIRTIKNKRIYGEP